MKAQLFARKAILALVGIAAVLGSASGVQASTIVNPGYDLFETIAGTSFMGVPFRGVPLGSFDFGSGPENVFNTDTIVHRLSAANAPSETIRVEMVALQLVSVVPVDLGAGLGFYYITLQSARGGPASLGEMTINFGPEPPGPPPAQPVHGTFNSAINVFFDVRFGSLNGPIVLTDALLLSSQGTPWSHLPPPAAVEIPGVNTFLNKTDRSADFFPIAPLIESHPTGAQHRVTTGSTPEPSSLVMAGMGLLCLSYGWRRSRRRAA